MFSEDIRFVEETSQRPLLSQKQVRLSASVNARFNGLLNANKEVLVLVVVGCVRGG